MLRHGNHGRTSAHDGRFVARDLKPGAENIDATSRHRTAWDRASASSPDACSPAADFVAHDLKSALLVSPKFLVQRFALMLRTLPCNVGYIKPKC
jgi:hypothetical protein